jgi:hypothetical protein
MHTPTTFSLSLSSIRRRPCSQPAWERFGIPSDIKVEKVQRILIYNVFASRKIYARPWTYRLPLSLKMVKGPDMVVHACNPSYSGGRGRRIEEQGQP